MEHIFTINKGSQQKGSTSNKYGILSRLKKSLKCSLSSKNVIAFSTEADLEKNNEITWSCNVYVADLNTPWIIHKVLVNESPISVLQWDFTGDLLLVTDENGCIRVFKSKDQVLNEWSAILQTNLEGENILCTAFFHSGKKICINFDKKDSAFYMEKFQNVKFACSVKQFGVRPANGVLILTTTGMLSAVLFPQTTSQSVPIISTESLAPTRIYIKVADICYGKNGHFLLVVSNGDPTMPIQCYKVTVKKVDDKCVITSQPLLGFFLLDATDTGMEKLVKDKTSSIKYLKWTMREDADSLVVVVNNKTSSCLQIWELREKSIPVHKMFENSDSPNFFNTVLWQYQCQFQYNSQVTSLTTSKLSLLNTISSGYIVVSFGDNSIHCLYRDSLKSLTSMTLSIKPNYRDEFHASKYQKISVNIVDLDMSYLGNVLLVMDSEDSLYLIKLPPHIDSLTPLSIPYCTTILEYCLVSGMDWLDLLLVLRSSMLDPLCDRLTESFNRQPVAVQQYYYIQYLCIKSSLYRLTPPGQSKANDLNLYLMLSNISTAFKGLLRPSEINSHEKSPADSLASVISDGQSDVDKLLMHLEPKEFTVEPNTLQSLQQLIQWVGDLALNLLVKVSECRSPQVPSKGYELSRDVKALNILREMLVLIRIWGLLRPACLPVFVKSDSGLDILALLFRLLTKLVQNVNDPDDNLLDDCCLLPSQVQVQPMQLNHGRIALASAQLSQQILPMQLEYNNEPEYLFNFQDVNSGQTIDSIRHLFLGKSPRVTKQCVRCGNCAGITSITRTAAIRAWDQRWLRSCQCGGHWRFQMSS